MPATLVLHGMHDPLVPVADARQFVSRLRADRQSPSR
jgi:dipeptidyl aminopeptidase/acylaminoacyl peptidase